MRSILRERSRAADARAVQRATAMRAGLPRTRRYRLLAGWLAASIALHALILLALPEEAVRRAPRVEILHVEIDLQPARDKPEPVRERSKPRLDPKSAPRAAPPSAAKDAAVKRQPPTLQGLEPMPKPMTVERADSAMRSPAAPAPAPPAPEIADPAPPEVPGATPPAQAPAPEPRQAAAPAPAPAPRIVDARPLFAPVRYPRTIEQGRVTLRVLVNREGRVAEAALAKTSGYRNLDRHALDAVKRWRFVPARRGAEALEQWLVVNVDY